MPLRHLSMRSFMLIDIKKARVTGFFIALGDFSRVRHATHV